MNTKTKEAQVFLWGAGKACRDFLKVYNDKAAIKGIIDSNIKLQNTLIDNILVFYKGDFKFSNIENLKVIITAFQVDSIKNELKQLGINDIDFCYGIIDKQEKVSVEKLKRILADEKSLRIVDKLLFWRSCGAVDYSQIYNIEQVQYLEKDIIQLTSYDYIMDCGAYTGDTLESIAKFSKWKKYFAIEADKKNFDKLNAVSANYSNVIPLNIAVGNKKGKVAFVSINTSSYYSERVNNKEKIDIELLPIDDLNVPVTFLKMDIEGAEMDALIGAEKTIKKYKPKLAICVYHKAEHLWEIPFLIKRFVPEYKIYLRHYSDSIGETVMYAIV